MSDSYQDLFETLSRPLETPNVNDIVLRPYQSEAIECVFDEWDRTNSTMIVMATGLGKTVVFTEIIDRWLQNHSQGERALIIAHREELIMQAVAHAKKAGLNVGIEMAMRKARNEEVVISSVQTLNAPRKCRPCKGAGCDYCDGKGRTKRMTKFNPKEFGLITTDEYHHGTAKTYRAVYSYFGQNESAKFFGVTATPKRTDRVGLHNVCDSVAYTKDLRSGIEDGYLVPIRQRFIQVSQLDLSSVKTKAGGDLADGDLERAFLNGITEDEERTLHELVFPTLQEAQGRQILFFCPGVESTVKVYAAFNAYDGVDAEYVIGTTDREERRDIIQRYKDGKIQVLVGCGVFLEGFDTPSTAVIGNARPTKSESLYLQVIGRGTRTLPGLIDGIETASERVEAIKGSDKPHVVVLDFVGNSGRHKLVSVANVLSGSDVDPIDVEEAIAVAHKEEQAVDMDEVIEKVKAAREEKERRREEEEERRRVVQTEMRAESGKYHAQDVDIFTGRSFNAFEDYTPPAPTAATQKQVNYLVKLGVHPETATKYSKRQAGKVIDSITSKTGSDFVMPFGKYSGTKLSALPIGYLQWLKTKCDNPKVRENIRKMEKVVI